MKTPCLNCKNRNLYCHSQCEKYKKFRNSIDKAKLNKQEIDFSNYLYDAIDRMKTIRNVKQGG